VPNIATVNFEDGTTQGFTSKQYGTLVASTMTAVTSPVYQGAYSGRLRASASGNIEASTAILPVAPFSDVAYSAAVAAGNVAREIRIQVSTYNGTTFKAALGSVTYTAAQMSALQGGWMSIGSASMNIGDADGVSFVVQVINAASNDYAHIDLISLDRVNPEGAYLYYESFNKANGAGIGPDQPWSENIAWTGVQTGFNTDSGALRHSVGVVNAAARLEVDLPSDQGAQMTITALPTPANTSTGERTAGLIIRAESGSTADSWYCLEIVHEAQYHLWKLVNGTRTNFASNAALPGGTLALPAKIQLTAQGSKIQATYNGAILQTVTDTSLTSGRAGIYVKAGGNVTRLDDFSAGPLEKIITLTGSVGLASLNTLRVPKTLSASLSPSGLAGTTRVVTRLLSGALSATGTYFRSVSFSTGGSLTLGGLLDKRGAKVLEGASPPSGTIVKRPAIWRRGDIAMTSELSVPFLGRVLGAAGTAIMRIMAAGEARMRFRRQ
jgi:hypothetical protein